MRGNSKPDFPKSAAVLAAFGILSLFLLDFPFLGIWTQYGMITLTSGLQTLVEGANLNVAQNIWSSYPPQVYYSVPGSAYTLTCYVPILGFLVAMIVGGAFIVETVGVVTSAFPERRRSESLRKLFNGGGILIFLGSVSAVFGTLLFITIPSLNYGGFVVAPGWAAYLELVVALFIIRFGHEVTFKVENAE